MIPEDGLTETQDVSLSDVSDTPMTVELVGRELNLNRLKLRDYTIAENYLRLQRGRATCQIVQQRLGRPLLLSEEIQIATQAAAMPITMETLCTEFDSRVQLIARGIVGNPDIPDGKALPWVLDNIDPSDHESLAELINKITGAAVPLGSLREEKSAPQAETSIPSSPNNGTAGSGSSVATTE
jgi:hypothetical protein